MTAKQEETLKNVEIYISRLDNSLLFLKEDLGGIKTNLGKLTLILEKQLEHSIKIENMEKKLDKYDYLILKVNDLENKNYDTEKLKSNLNKVVFALFGLLITLVGYIIKDSIIK